MRFLSVLASLLLASCGTATWSSYDSATKEWMVSGIYRMGLIHSAPDPSEVHAYAGKICPSGYETISEKEVQFPHGGGIRMFVRCNDPNDAFGEAADKIGPSGYAGPLASPEFTRTHPNVAWDDRLSAVADVTCDGRLDSVIVGRDANDKIWVGVAHGTSDWRGDRPSTVMSFPLGGGGQDAFCARPRVLSVQDRVCLNDEGQITPGCGRLTVCKVFSVSDEECDAFHFSWDDAKQQLIWERN